MSQSTLLNYFSGEVVCIYFYYMMIVVLGWLYYFTKSFVFITLNSDYVFNIMSSAHPCPRSFLISLNGLMVIFQLFPHEELLKAKFWALGSFNLFVYCLSSGRTAGRDQIPWFTLLTPKYLVCNILLSSAIDCCYGKARFSFPYSDLNFLSG